MKENSDIGEDEVWPPGIERSSCPEIESEKPRPRPILAVVGFGVGFLLTSVGWIVGGWIFWLSFFLYYRTRSPYFAWGNLIGGGLGLWVIFGNINHECVLQCD